MLKKILIVLAIVVGLFLVVVALQPSEFRVSRSAAIAAPPSAVFAQVNDLRKWQAWSPWEKIDPELKRTYEGPAAGTGASYSWAGTFQVGEGRMTIAESRPDEFIGIKLDFLKPFKSTCDAQFTFKPEGDRTVVTWSMAGKNNFIAKAIHLFMSMDRMIGGEFEKGLAQLKSIAEAMPK